MAQSKLVINADDLGLSKGVNLGIVEAYQHGIVTSATLMVNMGEVEHAVDLLKENPGLGVGIHLVLTAGRPISDDVPSLINTQGYFKHVSELMLYADVSDIEKEFRNQMDRFYALGLEPSHIDSHHHIHGETRILPVVLRLAQEYGLPFRPVGTPEAIEFQRDNNSLYPNTKTVDYFTSAFYGDDLSFERLEEILKKASAFNTAEIMTHPAVVDQKLLESSRYNKQRARELEILTDPRVWETAEKYNIKFVNYKDMI